MRVLENPDNDAEIIIDVNREVVAKMPRHVEEKYPGLAGELAMSAGLFISGQKTKTQTKT